MISCRRWPKIVHSIEVKEIGKRYGHVEALGSVSFSVAAGSFTAVVGPTGCGKTTLLRIIGGLAEPTTGGLLVGGRSAGQQRKRQEFGFVFQQPSLLPWRTVLQNVLLPFEIRGDGTGRAHAEQIIDLVGLAAFKGSLPHELSGGMQQRVALARALVTRPSVLLLDEPFSALDEITRERLDAELLRVWQRTRCTVLFVTHSLREAVFLADQVVVLSERPAVVRQVIAVGLPRPREADVRHDQAFAALVKAAYGALEG